MGTRTTLQAEVLDSTSRYERWLARQVQVLPPDLRLKHQRMAESPFAFFRATFYRWVELWRRRCAELDRAPRVLAVGDLHVENFGTWRDAEGRLVWGINDLDEAHPAAYTIDLARLATSVRLAAAEARLAIGLGESCAALLEGYRAALQGGGEPFVLADRHPWLRDIAVAAGRAPAVFWARMEALPRFRGALPPRVTRALERLLPARGLDWDARARVAGLGSLGRVRVVALARFEGGWAAREAKALLPSVLAPEGGGRRCWYGEALARAVRARDPFVRVEGWWLVRRLAPDCARVELSDLPARRDEARLLRNMGRETANLHLGSRGAARRILAHLDRQPAGWLRDAARGLADATEADAEAWRRHWRRAAR
jgi:hypothetical protein